MDFSYKLSKESIKLNILPNIKLKVLITNIDLLTIWLLKQSKEKVVSSGLARTTMEMFNLISLLKVSDLLDS